MAPDSRQARVSALLSFPSSANAAEIVGQVSNLRPIFKSAWTPTRKYRCIESGFRTRCQAGCKPAAG